MLEDPGCWAPAFAAIDVCTTWALNPQLVLIFQRFIPPLREEMGNELAIRRRHVPYTTTTSWSSYLLYCTSIRLIISFMGFIDKEKEKKNMVCDVYILADIYIFFSPLFIHIENLCYVQYVQKRQWPWPFSRVLDTDLSLALLLYIHDMIDGLTDLSENRTVKFISNSISPSCPHSSFTLHAITSSSPTF